METPRSFKKRSRRMQTGWNVRAFDAVSQWLITVGGIGTIVAVLFVFLFLLGRVIPLMLPASYSEAGAVPAPWKKETPLRVGIDEYQHLGWVLDRQGTLEVIHLDTGEKVDQQDLTGGQEITAASFGPSGDVAFGFADGTLRVGHISVVSVMREAQDISAAARELKDGDSMVWEKGVLSALPQQQFSWQQVKADLQAPVSASEKSIVALGHVASGPPSETKNYVATVDKGGVAQWHTLTSKKALVGKRKTSIESQPFDLPADPQSSPSQVLVGNEGAQVYFAWPDGRAVRFATNVPPAAAHDSKEPPKIARTEEFALTAGDAKITTAEMLAGRETLAVGDDAGNLTAWFLIRNADAETADGWQFTPVHHLPRGTAAVTSLSPSSQSRLLLAGYGDGSLRVMNVTTAHQVLKANTDGKAPITQVMMPSREDGLWAATGSELWSCKFNRRHPEATVGALLLPVWYEGHAHPKSMWQTTKAGDSSEAKMGLTPLIFGTLKATFYALLLGAPLALLAALYTSEFVHSQYKTRLKSSIELMASLPSVVLGFLAAIVFAPFFERQIANVLAGCITLPLVLIMGAQLWQLLPQRTAQRLRHYRIAVIGVFLAFGVLLARQFGPVLEAWLFGGNIMAWLRHDKDSGSALGGWWLLFLPVAGVAVLTFATGVLNPILRTASYDWSRGKFALVNLAKVVGCLILTAVLAWLLAAFFTVEISIGGWVLKPSLDPRGSLVDTYRQSNALVVGFVMGFAIIPIIYTLAEDALTTVPRHLRSASLGCGATPWQTAVRIVIPTAMSGLFSALMVGLGRAVGETMIVLMATGNTPIFDVNPFNGFRTLAASIAVELPEAARYSTHERMLYLAALVLFCFTFLVNTAAEIVRARFRKRAYQL